MEQVRSNETFKDVKDALTSAPQVISQRYQRARDATQSYVSGNPWKAIGIAAAIGVLLGLLVPRR